MLLAYYQVSLLARFLVVIAGNFESLLAFHRSIKLALSHDIEVIDIKWLVVGKIF